MATKLVAEGKDENGTPVRVVMQGTRRIVERVSRDALGGPCWREIDVIDIANPTQLSGEAAAAILHVLDDMVAKRGAVADTMNYSKPPNYREG